MNKFSNFHTHTYLCKHATGTPQDYFNEALNSNEISALGFSDHCPYDENFFDIWPHIRMDTDSVKNYISDINNLKQTSPFPIYLSFECEWEKEFSSWYKDKLIEEYKTDYLVLGSHWVTDNCSHIYALDIDNTKLLSKYIDQTIDGMNSKLFSFLAHPDLFMATYRKWDDLSKSYLKAILDAAIDLNMPLEINGLGLKRPQIQTNIGIRYQYPFMEFWEMVADSKVKVICNSDAHSPKDILENIKLAQKFAEELNLKPINSIF